jgi:ethanolamine ammonia-lyase large subunit
LDDVTALILRMHDQESFKPIRHWTVGQFREWLLEASGEQLKQVAWAITPEIAAAVVKLMALIIQPMILLGF